MSTVYAPPEGIYFRLCGYASSHCIFSRNQEPEVGHYHINNGDFEDQHFTLIHGTGKHAGKYAIKGKVSGKVLYSRNKDSPTVWHIGGNGAYEDNWFELEPGTGEYKGHFRLKTPSQGMVIYSRAKDDPTFSNYYASSIYSDHFFKYVFEALNFDGVDFDVSNGKIISTERWAVSSQTIANDACQTQHFTIAILEKRSQSSLLSEGNGFPAVKGTVYKANVPVVNDDDKIVIDGNTSHQLTYEGTDTWLKTHQGNFPVTIEPHKSVKVVSYVTHGDIEVPYTINFSSKTTGTKTYTKGVWRGTATWHLRSEVASTSDITGHASPN
ncbi:hemolytic lectin [Gloeopeniophorella convolvens]|nr:hemolytic lectin [Gloeopeniophorella convolvens]